MTLVNESRHRYEQTRGKHRGIIGVGRNTSPTASHYCWEKAKDIASIRAYVQNLSHM